MKLTKALKEWLSKNCGVAVDASDEDFRKAATTALIGGQLNTKQLHDLSAEGEDSPSMGKQLLDAINGLGKRIETLETKSAADPTESSTDDAVSSVDDTVPPAEGAELNSLTKSLTTAVDGMKSAIEGMNRPAPAVGQPNFSEEGPTPVKLFTQTDEGSQNSKDVRVRVKSAVANYDGTCSKAVYGDDCKHVELRGRQAHSGMNGHNLDNPSQLSKAVNGAWFKFMVNSACRQRGQSVPRCYKMTEHDNNLVQYAMHEMPFVGSIGLRGDNADFTLRGDRKMTEIEMKSILDDATSGGLEAAPIAFDDALILTPQLYGEIYPLVNVVNLTRGRRVEGFSMGNPTITSGTAEGTSIGLFNTASFIAAFDTTIFNAVGAIELGKDFEDDSPVNIGEQVMQSYGEALLAWLDEQIVVGDGTTEPEGVFTASGTTSVSTDNSTSGPPTLGDYEGLLFGIAKKYKPAQDRNRLIFASNETTYRRSRAMKVDPQSTGRDERRLLGLDHENYSTLGHPHKINESITNSKVAFFNARRYRMYRRLGTTITIEEGGKELTLKNLRLIVLRARYGGHLEDGAAAAVCTTAQS